MNNIREFPVRVLVVDDESDSRTTLTALLEHEGHEVRGLDNGTEVLAAVNAFRPDAVFLDLKLPDTSGFALAQEIRRTHGKRPLLVAITGRYKERAGKVLSEIVGFDHYLVKPCETQELLGLLSKLTA